MSLVAWFSPAVKAYRNKHLLRILVLGFASGLPLSLTFSTLSVWLAEAGINRTTIGLFAAVSTPYALKFLWAHMVDHLPLPMLSKKLGRRRAWIVFTQIGLMAGLVLMGGCHPVTLPFYTALFAVMVAFFSSTQDIAIDAYRVESLKEKEQGAGAAVAVFGYRFGMLVSGAGALIIAEYAGWFMAYASMAALMLIGVFTTLFSPEPALPKEMKKRPKKPVSIPWPVLFGSTSFLIIYSFIINPILVFSPQYVSHIASVIYWVGTGISIFALIGILVSVLSRRSLEETTFAPFRDILNHQGWAWLLLFIIFYKFGDAFAGVMTYPFLVDIGFSKPEIATIVKTYGFAATILGSFAGGVAIHRLGMIKSLVLCGILQMVSNLFFVWQAHMGHHLPALSLTIGVENFSSGMGTSAFVAYLSGLCNRHYTATQYALLSSLASIGRTWLSTASGWVVEQLGWAVFFYCSTAAAIPGLLILFFCRRYLLKNTG